MADIDAPAYGVPGVVAVFPGPVVAFQRTGYLGIVDAGIGEADIVAGAFAAGVGLQGKFVAGAEKVAFVNLFPFSRFSRILSLYFQNLVVNKRLFREV